MRIFKHSVKVTTTCPNSAIKHPGIYNLRDLESLQNEMHINNLLNRLNDHSLVSTTTLMRLKDLQINNWEPKNILMDELQSKLTTGNNLSGKILCAAREYGIRFTGPHIQEYFTWYGGNYSIKETLQNNNLYKDSIKSLQLRNIMYTDQVIDTNNKYIISWPLLTALTKTSTKGRTPKWYLKLYDLITNPDPLQPQRLSPQWQTRTLINPRYEFFSKLESKRSIKDWVGYHNSEDNSHLWGRIINKPKKDSQLSFFSVNHHIEHSTTDINEEPFLKLVPCKGCNKSRPNDIIDTCTILLPPSTKLKSIKGFTKKETCLPHPPTAATALLSQSYSNIYPSESSLSVIIHDILGLDLINKWIRSEEYNAQLSTALIDNTGANLLEFYTDGSLINQGTDQIRMGAAWIQSKGPKIDSSFKCGLENWPSSSHAEVVAILTALLVTPEYCKVDIKTDSSVCIENFKRVTSPYITTRGWLKIKNYIVWAMIVETIKQKSLSLNLIKVKAHSGITYNEKADLLAKNALTLPSITFNLMDAHIISAIPTWNNIAIEISMREFIKQFHRYNNLDSWSNQARIKSLLISDTCTFSQSNWQSVWKDLSIKGLHTSTRQSHKRSFHFKLLHDELPTLQKLAIRKPNIYKNRFYCPSCHTQPEDRNHLFSCLALTAKYQEIWIKSVIKTIKKGPKTKTEEHTKRLKTAMIDLYGSQFCNTTEIITFTCGIISDSFTTLTTSVFKNNRDAVNFLQQWSSNFRNMFRKEIWIQRCKLINKLEKLQGLTKKIKQGKGTSHQPRHDLITTNQNNHDNNCNNEQRNNNNNTNHNTANTSDNYSDNNNSNNPVSIHENNNNSNNINGFINTSNSNNNNSANSNDNNNNNDNANVNILYNVNSNDPVKPIYRLKTIVHGWVNKGIKWLGFNILVMIPGTSCSRC
jgi:ribonuclease HI